MFTKLNAFVKSEFLVLEHSDSIPRNACVDCETALRDYQESVTTGQTDTHTDRQTPDKVIPMCRYASQETQKCCDLVNK